MGLYNQWLAKVTASQNRSEVANGGHGQGALSPPAIEQPIQMDWIELLTSADQEATCCGISAKILYFPRIGRFAKVI